MHLLESIFVITLFLLYLVLWKVKQVIQKKETGIDPKVMALSSSGVQKYLSHLTNAISAYTALIIILHSSQIQIGSMFRRLSALNTGVFDIIGFAVGLCGLCLCLYAQIKMGSSWRVGIDEKVRTDLVTTGIYRFIRNPTYLGLFLLNAGVFVIWPTWTVFILNLVFVLFLDIQVRCEEDYLIQIHGDEYRAYKRRTKRYIPYIY